MAPPTNSQILCRVGMGALRRTGTAFWVPEVAVPPIFSRADATTCATFVGPDGRYYTAAANKLRVDYSPYWDYGLVDPLGNPLGGLLLEGSRTNAFTKSDEFDDVAWTTTRATISANAAAAPDAAGTMTADKLVEDSSVSNTHFLERATPALTDNVRQPWSVVAKAAGRTWIALAFLDKANVEKKAFFNLGTGVLGTIDSGVTAWIRKRADGYYRCAISADAATGATAPLVRVYLATSDGTISYTGDGSSGVYLWRGQFETDKIFPSSPIGTTTAVITRAADVLTMPFGFGPMNTTLLARLARPQHADVIGIITLPDVLSFSSAAPRLNLFFSSGSRFINCSAESVEGESRSNLAIPAGAELKICAQYDQLTSGTPRSRLDVGSGFSGYNTVLAVALAFSAYGNQTVELGQGQFNGELFGVLIDLIAASGLFTWNEMLAVL